MENVNLSVKHRGCWTELTKVSDSEFRSYPGSLEGSGYHSFVSVPNNEINSAISNLMEKIQNHDGVVRLERVLDGKKNTLFYTTIWDKKTPSLYRILDNHQLITLDSPIYINEGFEHINIPGIEKDKLKKLTSEVRSKIGDDPEVKNYKLDEGHAELDKIYASRFHPTTGKIYKGTFSLQDEIARISPMVLSSEENEIFLEATRSGFFDIQPRIALEELAQTLDMSKERLEKKIEIIMDNLIEPILTISNYIRYGNPITTKKK